MSSDEEAKAQTAEEEEVTLFDKIRDGIIKSEKIYEDDYAFAIRDLYPTAKVHFLVIPKDRQGLSSLRKAEERHIELLGRLMLTVAKVAEQEGLTEGYRVVINNEKHGCQSVYHLHIHVIGGEQLGWPPTGISKKED